MESARHAAALPRTIQPSYASLNAQDRADLAAMEVATSRIRHATEGGPYYMTIAQQPELEGRYNHRYRYPASQWLENAPFQPRELESMQYQTFRFSTSQDTIISLHAHEYPEERLTTADKSRAPTGQDTPSQGPKKVISLAAYKKKAAGETSAVSQAEKQTERVAKPPAVKGPAEREKAESAEVLAAIKDLEGDEAVVPAPKDKGLAKPEQVSVKKPALKRKREEDRSLLESRPNTNGVSLSQPPVKKTKVAESSAAKINEPASAAVSKDHIHRERPPPPTEKSPKKPVRKPAAPTQSSRPAEIGLPPRLSPLHEEAEKNDSPLLPDRLSPNLPANITAALKARKANIAGSAELSAPNPTSKKDGKLTPSTAANGVLKHKSPAPRNGFRANSSSPATADQEKRPPARTSAPEIIKDLVKSDDGVVDNKSLIVRLKFKKARREDVRRILALKPRPKPKLEENDTPESTSTARIVEISKNDAQQPRTAGKTVPSNGDHRDAGRRAGKGVAQKLGPAAKKTVERQPAPEKRLKAESNVEKPEVREPPSKKRKVDDERFPHSKSNGESDSEIVVKRRKPDHLELKKTPSTPAQQSVQSPTVASAQRSQHVTPGARNHLLSAVAMKRDLSNDSHANTPSAHSSTPVLNGHASSSQSNGTTKPSPSSQPSNKTPMQAAWEAKQRSLETLGREIKHSAQADYQSDSPKAQKLRAAVKSVECLICYILAFTCADEAALSADPKQTPTVQTWRSLTAFYTLVHRICKPFPLLAGLAAHLAVIYNTRILELTALKPSDGPSRDSIIELLSDQKTAFNEANANLDIDTLIDNFPKTWKSRTKSQTTQDVAPDPKTLLLGHFALPIGAHTSSARGARAGLAMLQEFLEKEKIDYQLRVKP